VDAADLPSVPGGDVGIASGANDVGAGAKAANEVGALRSLVEPMVNAVTVSGGVFEGKGTAMGAMGPIFTHDCFPMVSIAMHV
jgi:hypothetical protein